MNKIAMIKDFSGQLKKFVKTTKIDDYEVETPGGWVDVVNMHETIPYQVYELKLSNGYSLKCADNHIIINEFNEEVFVKNLVIGDRVRTDEGLSIVIGVEDLGYSETMYDLELAEISNRVYYTNGILSHNTHLAKKLTEEMFGTTDSIIRVDMSEYMEKHAVSKLVGAPPGYVGYEEGGQLTEKIRRKPYSVVLLDEIEKAHPDVFNILLQVLDEGHLTDGLGRKVDFRNTLIIMTSNVGARKLQDFGTGVGFGTKTKIENLEEIRNDVIEDSVKKAFSPEFLNRLDDIIIFKSLEKKDIKRIVEIPLNELKNRISEMGYKLKISTKLRDHLVEEGYDEKYGARPLNRAIQKYVEDPIAERMLEGDIKEGDTIKLGYSKNDITVDIVKSV